MASLSETLFVGLSLVASVALACPDQKSYAQVSKKIYQSFELAFAFKS